MITLQNERRFSYRHSLLTREGSFIIWVKNSKLGSFDWQRSWFFSRNILCPPRFRHLLNTCLSPLKQNKKLSSSLLFCSLIIVLYLFAWYFRHIISMLSMVVTASGDFVLLPCTKKYVLRSRKQIRHGSVPDPDLEIRGGVGGGAIIQTFR